MHLTEPQRGISLVLTLHQAMLASSFRSSITPLAADIFVFSYPLYLAVLYSMGRIQREIKHKIAALWIFSSVVITTLVNIGIQFFVEKSRPNLVLGLIDQKTETVLHKFLPTSSFPSDHAAVSMSIAIASIIRGIKQKNKYYRICGYILMIFSFVTVLARIATAVHRPTDIIGGILVGTIVPLLLSNKKISSFGEKIFSWIGKKI